MKLRQKAGCPLIIALFLALLAGCQPMPRGEAGLALEDLVDRQGDSRLKAQTPVPSRRVVEYTVDGRHHVGDVYLSPEGALAGIVLVPGVVPAGKDDSRLVTMAYTLARLRFAVLVPDLEGVRHYRMRSGDVREVADAFAYLISRPELVPEGRAGIMGFSYGAGPVLLAAMESDIRERVRFVVAVGGYYDLGNIVTYFTTGYYALPGEDGGWRYLEPNPYVKGVFALSNADLLERQIDRERLQDFAQAIIAGDRPVTPSAGLAPDARALFDLLSNEDPLRVPELIGRLPPGLRDELEGINPAAHDLSRLTARVILVHGRSDTLIPFTESIALARALPPGQAQLFLIDGLAHVEVQPLHQDVPLLLQAMEALLAQRARP